VSAKLPLAHLRHAVWPSMSWCWPRGQASQAALTLSFENLPAGHCLHSAEPSAAAKWPAPQGTCTVRAAFTEWPSAAGVQRCEPGTAVNQPGSHRKHCGWQRPGW